MSTIKDFQAYQGISWHCTHKSVDSAEAVYDYDAGFADGSGSGDGSGFGYGYGYGDGYGSGNGSLCCSGNA